VSFPLPSLRRGSFIAVSFALSTLFTGLFIQAYDGYVSQETMILSGSIASGKWAIQIILGALLLREKRWLYISQLAATCLIGSVTLLPFALLSGGPGFFFGSLGASIFAMSIAILIGLSRIGLSWHWRALWFCLLAIAVSLQITIVFHFIQLHF
jgi:hypothetical protein